MENSDLVERMRHLEAQSKQKSLELSKLKKQKLEE